MREKEREKERGGEWSHRAPKANVLCQITALNNGAARPCSHRAYGERERRLSCPNEVGRVQIVQHKTVKSGYNICH